jgi:hypothetical protein
VTYYAHAVDLAFAITVWKYQRGTFEYIIALLKHTPGSPTLTFEKLYVMFTRVKMDCYFGVHNFLQHTIKKNSITYNQKFLPQNGEWTLAKEDIGNHMYLILLHCWYPKYQKLL